MRIIKAAASAALLIGLGACTDGGGQRSQAREAAFWTLSAASPLGPPVNCIEQERVRGRAVIDDRTIDFTMEDGTLMRNRLPYSCPGLLGTNRFAYRTALPRLCSTDTITLVLPSGASGGNCGLGSFQPVAIPSRPGRLPRAR